MSARPLTIILVLQLTLACNGPLPFMSGGALSGEVAPTPSDWSGFEEFSVVQLETRPDAPYSVNIAYTLVDGVLYINAGDTETHWVQHMEDHPLVRLRISGVIYELRAERVTDGAEISKFGKAWTSQGAFYRDPAELDQVWIYRLVSR